MTEESSTRSTFLKCYRFTLDTAVLIMLGVFLWGFGTGVYDTFFYFDDTIPDEVYALDETIYAFMETARTDFLNLYENPEPLDTYSFSVSNSTEVLEDTENYERNKESVVYINTFDGFGYYIGAGTILTEDGVILTSNHVIEGSEQVVVTTLDGTNYEVVQVLGYDQARDIVFLKIDAQGLRPMPLGDSEAVRVGEKTLVIGHPENLLYSASLGNLSAVWSYHSQGVGNMLQITNPISMGNSGGAVLNQYGALIGVPSWSLEYEDNSVQVQNINFATPIHEALNVLRSK